MTLPFKPISQSLIDTVAHQAQQADRLRKNHNFHQLSERVQRFLNAMQPGTYVRPHRHLRSPDINGFEFFLVLQGELGLIIMDKNGTVQHTQRITATGEVKAIELAEGEFHTLIALAPNTVMLEIKEGPYDAQTDKEFLPQFPEEQTTAAQQQVQDWERLFQTAATHR